MISDPLLALEPKPAVLIVDDRADGLLALEAVLRSPRYDLYQASSGAEAVAHAEKTTFAVILLDVQMPAMDGFETADAIKRHETCRYAPIIYLTANNKETHQISRGYETGAVDYLFKPYDPHVLQSKVDVFVNLFVQNQMLKRQAQLLAEGEKREHERTLELEALNRALEVEMAERMRAQREILETTEREQKRLGQDLHDSVAQQLSAISMMSKGLWQKLKAQSSAEAANALEILELSKKAIQETRGLARGFYPIELERLGLFPALEELVHSVEKLFGVTCSLKYDDTIKIEDRTAATHVYRIIQEALYNAAKHGKAGRVDVALRKAGGRIELSVQDNGIGIPTNHGTPSGMGMRIMQYRTKMINASLVIDSPGREGTRVVCTLPA